MAPPLLRRLTSPPWTLVWAVGLAAALYFGAAGPSRGLSGDPIRYASISREMVERGDWTRLTLDDAPYANKPPLVLWASAASMSVLGYTEFAARLASRLFGVATVALLVGLLTSRHGRRAAFFGGVALATWLVFQRSASTGRLDTGLSFFTLAGIAAYLRADRLGPSAGRSLAVGALFGLALLSKQAGVLGPLAVAVGSLVARRGTLLRRTAPLALAALVAVAAPWYVLQAVREDGWVDRLRADLTRTNPAEDATEALRAYSDMLVQGIAWIVPTVLGVCIAFRRWRRDPPRALPEAILLSLVAVLVAGILTRSTHYARYFVPAVPAFAWFAGTWTAAAARAPWLRKGAVAAVAAAVLVVWPVVIATGRWPTRAKYGALERAVETVRAERPGAGVLPARIEPDSDSFRAASRYYFGMRLRPPETAGVDPPPFVLVRRKEGLPAFEEGSLVFREEDVALYRRP